jgi:hypothetical protein
MTCSVHAHACTHPRVHKFDCAPFLPDPTPPPPSPPCSLPPVVSLAGEEPRCAGAQGVPVQETLRRWIFDINTRYVRLHIQPQFQFCARSPAHRQALCVSMRAKARVGRAALKHASEQAPNRDSPSRPSLTPSFAAFAPCKLLPVVQRDTGPLLLCGQSSGEIERSDTPKRASLVASALVCPHTIPKPRRFPDWGAALCHPPGAALVRARQPCPLLYSVATDQALNILCKVEPPKFLNFTY